MNSFTTVIFFYFDKLLFSKLIKIELVLNEMASTYFRLTNIKMISYCFTHFFMDIVIVIEFAQNLRRFHKSHSRNCNICECDGRGITLRSIESSNLN